MNKSLKERMDNILDYYFVQEKKKLYRILYKKNFRFDTLLFADCLRIYQRLIINDIEVGFVYKVYFDYGKRRFKIVYYDDYEKVLFTDNADNVLSILEILFINNSNKRLNNE